MKKRLIVTHSERCQHWLTWNLGSKGRQPQTSTESYPTTKSAPPPSGSAFQPSLLHRFSLGGVILLVSAEREDPK